MSYGRVITVEIGVPGARSRVLSSRDSRGDTALLIGADIRRTSEGQTDSCEVRVANASSAERAALQQEGAVCRVLAGLGAGPRNPRGSPSQLFGGRVIPASVDGPRRTGGDRMLTWSVSDGGFDLLDVFVSQAWRGPVSYATVISDIVSGLDGLSAGAIVLGDPTARTRTAYAAVGRLRDVLDDLAIATNSWWSVQHGAVEFWPVGVARSAAAYTVGPGQGLIEAPSRIDVSRWSVRSVLLSGLLPGDAIGVRSGTVNGAMVVEDVHHAIDSHAGPWETTVSGMVES